MGAEDKALTQEPIEITRVQCQSVITAKVPASVIAVAAVDVHELPF